MPNQRLPEEEGIDVVIVGAFSPSIFHPEWFLRQGLIEQTDFEAASVKGVTANGTEIKIAGLKLVVISDRLVMGTRNISYAPKLQDMLLQMFTKLDQTQITACGINPHAHYLAGGIEYWHKIGHTLAPKDLIWEPLFENPGMQGIVIKAPRADPFPGEVNVTVEPSAKHQPGIYIKSNYHYGLPETSLHNKSVALLIDFLKSEWERATSIPRSVANRIFEKVV